MNHMKLQEVNPYTYRVIPGPPPTRWERLQAALTNRAVPSHDIKQVLYQGEVLYPRLVMSHLDIDGLVTLLNHAYRRGLHAGQPEQPV